MRYNISARRQQGFATVTATCAVATLRVDNGTAKDALIEDVTPYLGEKSAELVVNDETKKYAIQHNTKSGHTWIRVCSNLDEILEGKRTIDVTSNDPLGDETTMSDCLGLGLEMIIQGDNRLEEFNNKIVKPLLEVLKRCSKDLGIEEKQEQARECLRKLALYRTDPANVKAKLAEAIECVKSYLQQCESTSYGEDVETWESRAHQVFSEMPLGELGRTAHLADRISSFCRFEASEACSLVASCVNQTQFCGQSKPPKDFAVRKTNEHLLSKSQIDYSQYYNGAPRMLDAERSGTKPIYLANTMWYQADGGLLGGRYFEMALVTLFSNPKDYEMARQIWYTQKVPFDPEVYHHQDKIRPALNWLVKVNESSTDNQEMKKAWKDAVVCICRQKLINGYLNNLLYDLLCRRSLTDGAQIIGRHKQLHSTTLDQSDEIFRTKHEKWVETGRAIAKSQNLEKMNEFVEQSTFGDAWKKIAWSDAVLKTEFGGLLTSYGQRLDTENKEESAAKLLDLGCKALDIKLRSLVLTHWIDTIHAAVTKNLQSVSPSVLSQVDSGKVDLITSLLEGILGFDEL